MEKVYEKRLVSVDEYQQIKERLVYNDTWAVNQLIKALADAEILYFEKKGDQNG